MYAWIHTFMRLRIVSSRSAVTGKPSCSFSIFILLSARSCCVSLQRAINTCPSICAWFCECPLQLYSSQTSSLFRRKRLWVEMSAHVRVLTWVRACMHARIHAYYERTCPYVPSPRSSILSKQLTDRHSFTSVKYDISLARLPSAALQ